MDIELLGQFGQRLLTLHGSQGHLRFESRCVVPAGSSAHRLSCSAAILAAVRQKLHSSTLFKNPEPALSSRLMPTWAVTDDFRMGAFRSRATRMRAFSKHAA